MGTFDHPSFKTLPPSYLLIWFLFAFFYHKQQSCITVNGLIPRPLGVRPCAVILYTGSGPPWDTTSWLFYLHSAVSIGTQRTVTIKHPQ